MDLNKIYSTRGLDGLSRADKERMSVYNRREYLFDKFLNTRKNQQTLQLTHEHILNLGDKSLRKLELSIRKDAKIEHEQILRKEISRLEAQVEQYKNELKNSYNEQFENEKNSMKESFEALMRRIEKQRDEAEEERMKELIRRMNEECEIALKKQWQDAEEIKRKHLEQMRKIISDQIYEEMRIKLEIAVQKALEEAEEKFNIREKEAMERTRQKCEQEANEKIRLLCERYDASIEALLQKLKQTEEKLKKETELRTKFENDFRLLQTDYKRFMNYTDHYNSDYMMKLRHIGTDLIQDTEYEFKLDDKLNSLVLNKNKKK